MKSNFFQKPLAWALIVAIAAVSGIYAFYNFNKANPMVGLDIQMNRDAALDKAANIASTLNIGPENYKTAVVFTNDNTFQNFVELEAGGLEKFKEILDENLYSSFSWKVRHFIEHETNEVTFTFTPSGEAYGFTEKLADAEAGAALNEEEALAIAASDVQAKWGLDLSAYELVEKSKEEVESGRIDHSFIYERKDIAIGEAKYRLRLKLSGNKLTQLQYFVKVPDEFNRRYAEMRSNNDTMASFGTVGLIVIYGLFGVFVGLFFLLKSRRLVWKPALLWGLIIAFGSMFLTTINEVPLSWFAYDTSTAAGNFLSSTLINAFMLALGMGAIIALTFMSAEGLGRSAFPRHIQLWKAWGKESGGSLSMLGQTMSGYLFTVIFLAIDILFYVITKKFGWWSPAGELSDPNILANYMPWFNSIAYSLQAGFWEEALCRAIPLAGIVLLTRKSKYKNFWIILVLIVQTLIFGSAHANYPQQPSYARVLEMVIPFIIFGLIYLGYGLIPIIIAHFAIDVFWFSLPLWVAKSPGIWTDRLLVLVFLFIPLWIVLYRRLRNRKWTEVPDKLRNIGWEAPAEIIKEKVEKVKLGPEKSSLGKILLPAGIVGIALWLLFTTFKADAPGMEISKQEAEEIAVIALSERFGIDVEDWTLMSNISAATGLTHKFIWLEYGKDGYEKTLGSFLAPPKWNIRLVKSSGEVEDRAEEYSIGIDVHGKVLSYSHKIPEKWEGAVLEQEEAQVLVDSSIEEFFGLDRKNLKEVSITPEKQENRRDWTFVYADTLNYGLDKGQGRYRLSLAGDQAVFASAFVHIPEDWERTYKDKQSKLKILRGLGSFIPIIILIAGMVWGIIRWTRKKFSPILFVYFGAGILALFIVNIYLSWDSMMFSYQTSMPMSNFITMLLVSMGIAGIFSSAGLGIIGGMSTKLTGFTPSGTYDWLKAIGLGFLLVGLQSLLTNFEIKTSPLIGDYSAAGSLFPALSMGLNNIQAYVGTTGFLLILYFALDQFTGKWTKSKLLFGGLTILTGILLQASGLENYVYWIVSGILVGLILLLVYILFLRYHFNWIPLIAAVFVISGITKEILMNTIPSVLTGGILGILLIAGISWWWFSKFQTNETD